jgi:hypothetical protein
MTPYRRHVNASSEFAMPSLDFLYPHLYPLALAAAESSIIAAVLFAAGAVLFIRAVSALLSAIRSQMTALTALLVTAFRLFVVAVVVLALILTALLSCNDDGPPDQDGPGPIQQDRPPRVLV